jgi:hypothetical protein
LKKKIIERVDLPMTNERDYDVENTSTYTRREIFITIEVAEADKNTQRILKI